MKKTYNLLIETKKIAFGIVTITAIFSISYAILRYNIFGQVPWKDLPFYILNKAISLTAIILFTVISIFKSLNKSRVHFAQKWIDSRTIIEPISFSLVIIHVLISLMLFKSEIYAKFFEENGTINLLGGISMIAGIISFVLLWSLKQKSLANTKNSYTSNFFPTIFNVVMIFIMVHLFFMGYNGWVTPEKWHGGMPPISLIAFIFGSVGLLLKVFIRPSGILKN
ncbi:MAG: hypothetical protein GQ525_14130 [Draconibacterium sp.]|nr:hypothetical protein [Draconibacterium sp.]